MADLSGYIPIYVRTTGDDTTGNGTSEAPFATAQKAFDVALIAGSGNFVIDLGVGSFGGVTLAENWPSHIAVRGVSSSQSNLGGIVGVGTAQDWDAENSIELVAATPGPNITIVSDKSVYLGDVSTTGGAVSQYNINGKNGGNISLTDVVCGTVTSVGSISQADPYNWGFYVGASGSILISGGETGYIVASATILPVPPTELNGGAGGNVVVTDGSVCGDINAAGQQPGSGGGGGPTVGGSGGSVIVTDSSVGDINVSGGGGGYVPGSAGTATITRSSCGDVDATPGGGGGDAPAANPGSITATDSVTGALVCGTGRTNNDGLSYYNQGPGTVTLVGDMPIPQTIFGNLVVTNLKKGRGVKGSSILGVA